MLAALWGCPVWHAKRICTAREFIQWQEFYKLDPWGEERADLRSGIIAAMFYNANRRRGARTMKPGEFILTEDGSKRHRRRKMSTSEMIAVARRFAKMHNAMLEAR